jgi:hypothetical protein
VGAAGGGFDACCALSDPLPIMTTTLNTRWIVVVVIVIGAAVTWLWVGRAVMPIASGTAEPQAAALHELAPPTEAHSQEQSGPLGRARPPVPAIPRPEAVIAGPSDDSTFARMLALAVSRSDAAEVTRRISETHERFVLTPDDPGWARQTEQALRDFFRSRSANTSAGIEITSVACRSAGCEVQAVVQMAFAASNSETASISQESGRQDPREVLHEIWPVGPTLKQEDYIGSDLFESDGTAESVGFIVWYARIKPQQEPSSPRSNNTPPL